MKETEQAAPSEFVVESAELSPQSFARLADFVNSKLGIKMPESKLTMVQSRLQRRVRELGMESVDQYSDYFFSSADSEELEFFINTITTNKTDFFREPDHFAYLASVVLPGLSRAWMRGSRVKVWSAGCSSGEEPYTLAMVLAEFASGHPGFDFAILATDVSTKVLVGARKGIYPEAHILPVPPELRRKYLLCSQDDGAPLARVVPRLRQKVSFHQLNFMDADYCVRDVFDVLFFRNVMIYFDKSTQEAVINKLCRSLSPGGYLFAGHSESLAGLEIPVQLVKTAVYRKPA